MPDPRQSPYRPESLIPDLRTVLESPAAATYRVVLTSQTVEIHDFPPPQGEETGGDPDQFTVILEPKTKQSANALAGMLRLAKKRLEELAAVLPDAEPSATT